LHHKSALFATFLGFDVLAQRQNSITRHLKQVEKRYQYFFMIQLLTLQRAEKEVNRSSPLVNKVNDHAA
jgi:predicted secreted Zn-dependent protease